MERKRKKERKNTPVLSTHHSTCFVPSRASGTRQPRAPSMAHRAWMTSISRYRAKVAGSADRPAVSQP